MPGISSRWGGLGHGSQRRPYGSHPSEDPGRHSSPYLDDQPTNGGRGPSSSGYGPIYASNLETDPGTHANVGGYSGSPYPNVIPSQQQPMYSQHPPQPAYLNHIPSPQQVMYSQPPPQPAYLNHMPSQQQVMYSQPPPRMHSELPYRELCMDSQPGTGPGPYLNDHEMPSPFCADFPSDTFCHFVVGNDLANANGDTKTKDHDLLPRTHSNDRTTSRDSSQKSRRRAAISKLAGDIERTRGRLEGISGKIKRTMKTEDVAHWVSNVASGAKKAASSGSNHSKLVGSSAADDNRATGAQAEVRIKEDIQSHQVSCISEDSGCCIPETVEHQDGTPGFNNSPGQGMDKMSTSTHSTSQSESMHAENSLSTFSAGSSQRGLSGENWKSAQIDQVVEKILNSLNLWLLYRLSEITCGNGQGGSVSQPVHNASCTVSTTKSSSTTSTKRSLEHSNDPEDNGHGSDDGSPNKRPRGTARDMVDPRFLFACPFFKRNLSNYHGRRSSCAGPGWVSIHRLKEHLYRCHALPEHKCPRCCKEYKTANELSQHLLADTRCEIRHEEPLVGLDKDQERLLKCRKKPKSETNEVERWNRVYKVLFPSEEVIPSPYYDSVSNGKGSDMIRIFRDVQQQFPILMRQRLTAEINELVESRLGGREQIINIAQDVLRCLLEIRNVPQTTSESITRQDDFGEGGQLPLNSLDSTQETNLNEPDDDFTRFLDMEEWDDNFLFESIDGLKCSDTGSGYGSMETESSGKLPEWNQM